jgi:hypothetical protein
LGRAYEGEDVVSNGAFDIDVGSQVYSSVSATVTHVFTNNTSEFGNLANPVIVSLDLQRAVEPPGQVQVQQGKAECRSAV